MNTIVEEYEVSPVMRNYSALPDGRGSPKPALETPDGSRRNPGTDLQQQMIDAIATVARAKVATTRVLQRAPVGFALSVSVNGANLPERMMAPNATADVVGAIQALMHREYPSAIMELIDARSYGETPLDRRHVAYLRILTRTKDPFSGEQYGGRYKDAPKNRGKAFLGWNNDD
jgi:hypothetical protein